MSDGQTRQLPRLSIAEGDVHIWHLLAEQIDDASPLRALLAPDEIERMGRYGQERDRLLFLLSRALMRSVLAGYLGCAGSEVRLAVNAHGKPVLAGDEPLPLHFNLSHTRGAIAFAVSRAGEVGIDIEERGRVVEYLPLAERYFTTDEARHLHSLPAEERREAFFAIWTLKEAFVKAIGRGLTFPLDAFCFDLDGDRFIRFRPLDESVSPDWHFAQFEVGEHHCGALAVQRVAENEPKVELRDWCAAFEPR